MGCAAMEIKVTKKLLKNYQKYKREIPLLEAELEWLWTTDAGIGNSTILDYSRSYPPQPQGVVGFDQELYNRRKNALNRRKAQVEAVEQWIRNIEDGQVRCIFRMRYMEGMSWVKIAEKTGYGGREDYVRRHIRDKYLEKCKIR